MDLLDTRTGPDNLTGTLIVDLVLQLLAYVAQTEREYIRQRQAEGIAAAKERGQRLGRPPLDLPEHFEEVFEQHEKGLITQKQGGELLGISASTFHRRHHKFLGE